MKDNENTTVDATAPEQPESPEGSSAATAGYTATGEGEEERLKAVLELALSLGLHARPVTKQETGMRLQAVEVWGEALDGHFMREVPEGSAR